MAVAAVVAALTLPWVGAEAHQGGGDGRRQRAQAPLFASDGLRQDAVAEFADDRVTPGFRALLRQEARTRPATAC